ncbi:MAG: hypothetical protein JWQ78_339 [Sediminibacterium sp.]|nr:hypothetical protein [Sediminibacterium sp.]
MISLTNRRKVLLLLGYSLLLTLVNLTVNTTHNNAHHKPVTNHNLFRLLCVRIYF